MMVGNCGGSWVSGGEDDYHPDREYLAKIKQFELGHKCHMTFMKKIPRNISLSREETGKFEVVALSDIKRYQKLSKKKR